MEFTTQEFDYTIATLQSYTRAFKKYLATFISH